MRCVALHCITLLCFAWLCSLGLFSLLLLILLFPLLCSCCGRSYHRLSSLLSSWSWSRCRCRCCRRRRRCSALARLSFRSHVRPNPVGEMKLDTDCTAPEVANPTRFTSLRMGSGGFARFGRLGATPSRAEPSRVEPRALLGPQCKFIFLIWPLAETRSSCNNFATVRPLAGRGRALIGARCADRPTGCESTFGAGQV